jgi:hypothetical protein
VNALRDWIETHLPPWLVGMLDWPGYRLFSRCWAQGCGRPMVLHMPRQVRVCENTPMAIELTGAGLPDIEPEPVEWYEPEPVQTF